MTYIRKTLIIPKQIWEQGDNPQWSGVIDTMPVEVFYDDDISGGSSENQYAVFSSKGFHGWLSLGFTMSEIQITVRNAPIDYQDAYDDYEE